ncbi:MAG: hypothetical protein HN742_10415 [Lentisphaerae bacterium]|nr:hypothetical protein [Lentisphaerota bacterium]MBT4816727.1 hypothetical protein [Lentisphaerota bacterium]MBT5611372.1 hypothetical protein [Lentisphaerota bacterium]MBT7062311.1 hypothetical protein [Lentisphaerota bacterium]MBT7842277.1 hypothetical protein [Lentisphaerota bacterium]
MNIKNMRMTNWSFKLCEDNLRDMAAPCMDPVWIGAVSDDVMRKDVRALRRAGFNTLIVEGLRRLVLYEHNHVSAEVRAAIARAVGIAHAEGMDVFYHSTCSFANPSLGIFTEHEKTMLSIDGETGEYAFVDNWNGWYLWCMNNPDFQSEYYRLAKLMVAETQVDGMMTDEVYFRTGWHDCVCPHCLKTFGKAAPEPDFSDPDWREWLRFRLQSTGDFYEGLRKAIGDIPLLGCKNDEPNPSHSQLYGENNDERMRGTSILFTEVCTRSGKKEWRSTATNCAAYQGVGVHYDVPVLGLSISDTKHIEFAWALRMAHGIRPWGVGSALMERSLSPEDNLTDNPEDVAEYARLFRWEDQCSGLLSKAGRPVADVALLLSSATRDQYDCRDHSFYREFHGWSNALTDAHIQFSVVHEDDLDRLDDEFTVLILPHAVCLRDFSFNGRIIATGNSGTYCPTGEKRAVPLFEETSPLGEFDVAGLPTPVTVLEAPANFLVRAVHTDSGCLVHLLNCGDKRGSDIAISIPGMIRAKLLSPDMKEALTLSILGDTVRFPAASFATYAVLHCSPLAERVES